MFFSFVDNVPCNLKRNSNRRVTCNDVNCSDAIRTDAMYTEQMPTIYGISGVLPLRLNLKSKKKTKEKLKFQLPCVFIEK